MVFCIGLTGAIATGKSLVTGLFAQKGIAIISADNLAKMLLMPNQPALNQIRSYFGESIMTATGTLDRPRLRELIFNHPTQRKWLEALLHPLIRSAILESIQSVKSAYCVIEIPLLSSRADYPYLNRILLVLADSTIQLQRAMARDHCSLAQAKQIMDAHPSDDQRVKIADDIILNNGSIDTLASHVDALHLMYLKLSHEERRPLVGPSVKRSG